jgi:hypothetical protein
LVTSAAKERESHTFNRCAGRFGHRSSSHHSRNRLRASSQAKKTL